MAAATSEPPARMDDGSIWRSQSPFLVANTCAAAAAAAARGRSPSSLTPEMERTVIERAAVSARASCQVPFPASRHHYHTSTLAYTVRLIGRKIVVMRFCY